MAEVPKGPDLDGAMQSLDSAFTIDADLARDAFRMPEHGDKGREKVTIKRLNAIVEAIVSDSQIETYEEMKLLNEALHHRARLSVKVRSTDGFEEPVFGYRAANEQIYPNAIRTMLERLALYTTLKAKYSDDYKEFEAHPELEQATAEYVAELAKILRARTAIGEVRSLFIMWASFGRKPQKEKLASSLRDLKTSLANARAWVGVDGRKLPEEARLPALSISNRDISQITRLLDSNDPSAAIEFLQRQDFLDAADQLERDINWFMTAEKGVPGVLPELEGNFPMDEMLGDLLANALATNVDEDKDAESKKKSNELKERRYEILLEIRSRNESLGGKRWSAAMDMATHEIFEKRLQTLEAMSNEEKDFAAGLFVPKPTKEDYRKQRERIFGVDGQSGELGASMDNFRSHIQGILGSEEEEGLFAEGLGVKIENLYNKKGRYFVVLPLIQSFHAIRTLPRRLANKIPLLEKVVKDPEPLDKTLQREMRPLCEKWGLPECVTIDGERVPFSIYEPSHWEALEMDEEQFKELEKAMRSTQDVLREHEAKIRQSLDTFQNDMNLVQTLLNTKHPDDLIGTYPNEELLGRIRRGTDIDMSEIKDDADLAAAYLGLKHQGIRHWNEYVETMYNMDVDLGGVLDFHLDSADLIKEQGPFPWWMVIVGGGLAVWYGSAFWRAKRKGVAGRFAPRPFRALGVMARDVPRPFNLSYRISRWTFRKGKWHLVTKRNFLRPRGEREWQLMANELGETSILRTGEEAAKLQRMVKLNLSPEARLKIATAVLEKETASLAAHEKNMIEAVHKIGLNEYRATGKWSRGILRQKYEMLTGTGRYAKAVEGFEGFFSIIASNGSATGERFKFTPEQAKILMRTGVCGLDKVTAVIRALKESGFYQLAEDLTRRTMQIVSSKTRTARIALRGVPWGSVLRLGGGALVGAGEGLALRGDIQEMVDAHLHTMEIEEALHDALTDQSVGFEYDAQSESYVHPDGTICEVNRGALQEFCERKENLAGRQFILDAGIAGAMLTSVICTESGVGIPIALLLSAGAITLRTKINAKRREEALEYVRAAEPHMLTYLGTSPTGFHELELLYKNCADTIANEEKKKLLFAFSFHELRKDPKLLERITGFDFSPQATNTFYNEDFQNIILPALSTRLFAIPRDEEAGATYSSLCDLILQSEKMGIPHTYPKHLQQAFHNVYNNVYLPILLERRWIYLRRDLNDAIANEDYDEAIEIDRMLAELGKERVFGSSLFHKDKEIMEIDNSHHAKYGAECKPITRMELAMEELQKNMERGKKLTIEHRKKHWKDMTQFEMLVAEEDEKRGKQHYFSIDTKRIPGLPSRFDIREITRNNLDQEKYYLLNHGGEVSLEEQGLWKETGITGSVLKSIDPMLPRTIEERQQQNMLPYECMGYVMEDEIATESWSEVDKEANKTIYATRVEDSIVLLKSGMNDCWFKVYEVGERDPVTWEYLDHEIHDLLHALITKRAGIKFPESNAHKILVDALRRPDRFSDSRGVEQIATLFIRSPDHEKFLKKLTQMAETIDPDEPEYRAAFTARLLEQCALKSGTDHFIETSAEFRSVTESLSKAAENGVFGKRAEERMSVVGS